MGLAATSIATLDDSAPVGDSEWCAGLCSPCHRVALLLHERLIYLWVNSNFNLQVLEAVRRPAHRSACLLPTAVAVLVCGACSLLRSCPACTYGLQISGLGSRLAQCASTRNEQVRHEGPTAKPRHQDRLSAQSMAPRTGHPPSLSPITGVRLEGAGLLLVGSNDSILSPSCGMAWIRNKVCGSY